MKEKYTLFFNQNEIHIKYFLKKINLLFVHFLPQTSAKYTKITRAIIEIYNVQNFYCPAKLFTNSLPKNTINLGSLCLVENVSHAIIVEPVNSKVTFFWSIGDLKKGYFNFN